MKAIELLEKYINDYTKENKHKTSPAMIKFNLEKYYKAIVEIETLQKKIQRREKNAQEDITEIIKLREALKNTKGKD